MPYCLSKFCCLCLKNNNNLLVINKSGRDITFQKIKDVLPKLAIFKQELPASICPKCHSRIRKIYKFKKMCMRNACRLSEYINILKKRSSDKKFNDMKIVLNRDQLLNLENIFDTYKNVDEPVILFVGQDWHEDYEKFNIGVNYNTQIVINNSDLLTMPENESSNTTKHVEETNLPIEKPIIHIKEEITETVDRQLDPDFVNECNSIITEYFQEEILPLENERVYIKEEIIQPDETELLTLQENNENNIEFVKETVLPLEKPTIYIKEERFDVKEKMDTNDSVNQVDQQLVVESGSSCEQNRDHHKSDKFMDDYKTSPLSVKMPHSSQKKKCNHNFYANRKDILTFCRNLSKYPDNNDILLLKCIICSNYYGNKKNLQEHIRSHFKCVLCVKKGRQPRKKPVYGFPHVDDNGEVISTPNGLYKCEICNRMFALEARLKEHKKSHGIECQVCDLTFRNQLTLDMHMTTHSNVIGTEWNFKKFKCEKCDKKFALEANRNTHMIYHLDAICSLCGITFSSKPSWLMHMRIHYIDKEFECEFCKKQFALKENLETHLLWCNKNTM